MSQDPWDAADGAEGRPSAIGHWKLNFRSNIASWDEVAGGLLRRGGPESAEAFVRWLNEKAGGQNLPHWIEDSEWSSSSLSFRSPDGARYIRLAGQRDGHVWAGVVQDVTRERMLRFRVAEAERLEAVGRLSSGVAHNFNNMLTIITACLADAGRRLSEQAAPDPEIVRDIEDAQEAAERAAMVVGNLSRLAHDDDHVPTEICQAQALCLRAADDLRRISADGLEVVLSVPRSLWVRQSPGVIEQVLNNLLINANHALAGRKNPTVWIRGARIETFGQPTLELVISDNGPGVPTEIEPDLFQPFVTSKGKHGTGLGLATAAESLRRLDGQIAYRERTGGGAEFVLLLPLAHSPTEPKPEPGPTPPGGDLAGAQILVVDDEPVIRRLVQRILGRAGATVTAAADLNSAREVLNSSSIDAVLLDRTLGPERGIDLLPSIRALSPAAQVIVFSGEPVGPREQALVDAVVSKPIGGAALIDAISHALSRAPEDCRHR